MRPDEPPQWFLGPAGLIMRPDYPPQWFLGPAGLPVFLHRTLDKLALDRQPLKLELCTGPMPLRWAPDGPRSSMLDLIYTLKSLI